MAPTVNPSKVVAVLAKKPKRSARLAVVVKVGAVAPPHVIVPNQETVLLPPESCKILTKKNCPAEAESTAIVIFPAGIVIKWTLSVPQVKVAVPPPLGVYEAVPWTEASTVGLLKVGVVKVLFVNV